MIVIVVLDDKDGMMFNQRRQSQDQVLRDKILALSKEKLLWMNEYTAKQFPVLEDWVRIDPDFLQKVGAGEYCFVENQNLTQVASKIEKMILFKWNRRYPGDLFLDIKPEMLGMACSSTCEFEGSSHEKITMELWEFLVKE